MRYLHSIIIAALALLAAAVACSPSPDKDAEEYPLFWTWLSYSPDMDMEAVCATMDQAGIKGMMLESSDPEVFKRVAPITRAHGITLYSWFWAINPGNDYKEIAEQHPDWFQVNREGKSLIEEKAYVDYYKFLTPALPEVRDYLAAKVKAVAEVEGVDGVSIDYHRMPDVVLPTTLWGKYGVVQDREYPQWDYDYHPAMIEKFMKLHGYDPRELEDPSKDEKWLKFRCDQIAECANVIADVVHAAGKKMCASPFPTPKMSARMVRQYWGDWDLDIVFPMVYSGFYTEDPSFAYDCTIENQRDKNPATLLGCGLGVSWGEDKDNVFKNIDAAFAAGAQAISIFTVRDLKTPEMISKFREYVDRYEAIRAANGGNIPVPDVSAADPDPFHHETLMKVIEGRMQKVAGLSEPVNPGEWELIEEYDVTKNYSVVDLVSGTRFRVSFYSYGGMISGWNVYLDQ